MYYQPQNIEINIYISKTDLNAGDKIYLYLTNNPSADTLLGEISSVFTDADPSNLGDSYLFSYWHRTTEPDTYTFAYKAVDEHGNKSSLSEEFSIEVCLAPLEPSPLSIDSADDSEIVFDTSPLDENTSSAETVTVYYYEKDSPSVVITAGSELYGTEQVTINTPASDGTYYFYQTIISDCGEESSESDLTTIIINNGFPELTPYMDVTELSCLPTIGGKFIIWFSYTYSSTLQNPTQFNIYYNQNPSADNWVLDGNINYSSSETRYTYTTVNSFSNGEDISFKVVPCNTVGSDEYERDTDTYITSEADSIGPVITNDYIDINLI